MTIFTVAEKLFPSTTSLECECAVSFQSLPLYPPNLDDSRLLASRPNSFLHLQRLQQWLSKLCFGQGFFNYSFGWGPCSTLLSKQKYGPICIDDYLTLKPGRFVYCDLLYYVQHSLNSKADERGKFWVCMPVHMFKWVFWFIVCSLIRVIYGFIVLSSSFIWTHSRRFQVLGLFIQANTATRKALQTYVLCCIVWTPGHWPFSQITVVGFVYLSKDGYKEGARIYWAKTCSFIEEKTDV